MNMKKKITPGMLALAGFVVVELIMILVATLAMKEPVVAVCAIMIGAAGIGALMHNAELWLHGVVILVELIVAVLIARVPLMVLCIVIYLSALVALKFYDKERNM